MDEIRNTQYAISKGIYPTRIAQGSSGSYFCRTQQDSIVGVFKPKDEEPYSDNNPKFVKRVHRTCFPCVYGRSCLGRGLGYVSEASASVVDQALGLNVCPPTVVCSLAAPTFHYVHQYRADQYKTQKVKIYSSDGIRDQGEELEFPFNLPAKIGSFQKFMNGYQNASQFLKLNPYIMEIDVNLDWCIPAPDDDDRDLMRRSFQFEFEKMVILDYLIRNTDRGADNWMIKVTVAQETDSVSNAAVKSVKEEKSVKDESILEEGSPTALIAQSMHVNSMEASMHSAGIRKVPQVSIAAIDNGLAFPFKHPDSWRSYPFAWLTLPCAQVPFSTQIRHETLRCLQDPVWWNDLVKKLEVLWQMDADFDPISFKKRMAVMKGQAYNLVQVLKRGSTFEVNDGTSSRSPSPGANLLSRKPSPQKSQQQPPVGTPAELADMPQLMLWESQDIRSVNAADILSATQNRALPQRSPWFKNW